MRRPRPGLPSNGQMLAQIALAVNENRLEEKLAGGDEKAPAHWPGLF